MLLSNETMNAFNLEEDVVTRIQDLDEEIYERFQMLSSTRSGLEDRERSQLYISYMYYSWCRDKSSIRKPQEEIDIVISWLIESFNEMIGFEEITIINNHRSRKGYLLSILLELVIRILISIRDNDNRFDYDYAKITGSLGYACDYCEKEGNNHD